VALAADLSNLLDGGRDFEDRLDLLRRWANERRFQVGVQLLRRALDGAAAGCTLSDIAETALAALLPLTMAEFARTHGEVAGGAFAIVAMGRLGSREMSLASDIDLILIYDAPAELDASDGPRPLAIPAYYARLSQRLIGAITAPTAEGRLYEVDMRLRPSGSSGPIASSLDAFARYQRDDAWTWERMALTRARPVAGDPALCGKIEDAIRDALTAPRDPVQVVVDVDDMRARLIEANPRPSLWDLRNRRGGLVDLEFIVQYLVLREAHRAPQVLQRDSARALTELAGIDALSPRAAQELGDSFALLRHVRALLALLFAGIPTQEELSGPAGASLARCAGEIDFPHLDANISSACARVRFWYDRIVARPAQRAAQKPDNTTGDAVQ
jgi:glutamate-ammonia-ligase adenylyltransferase